MNDKHVILVGYTSQVFIPFARALEDGGFTVHWIHSSAPWSLRVVAAGWAADRIVDVARPGDFPADAEDAERRLAALERPGEPRVRDIILMDRLLRRKSYHFAVRYLAYAAEKAEALLMRFPRACVSSGRDTALQMIVMLVCRKLGIPWCGVTYARLPVERFGFTESYDQREFLPLRPTEEAHVDEARAYLLQFRERALKPYLRPGATSLGDVAGRLGLHLRLWSDSIRDWLAEPGNDYSRYTPADLVGMYLRKKVNLLQVRLFQRTLARPRRPFVIFGLHRQPESSIDVVGSFYSDQFATIRQISRCIPMGYDLLVKPHISDVDGRPREFYRQLERLPGVHLLDPLADSRDLLRGAALVITISGTMAYEAGLLGRPAISLVPLFFTALPTVRYCPSVTALSTMVAEALADSLPDDERTVRFLADLLARTFPVMPNRSHVNQQLTEGDLRGLVAAYESLHAWVADRTAGVAT
jgi:hypothetical protein